MWVVPAQAWRPREEYCPFMNITATTVAKLDQQLQPPLRCGLGSGKGPLSDDSRTTDRWITDATYIALR